MRPTASAAPSAKPVKKVKGLYDICKRAKFVLVGLSLRLQIFFLCWSIGAP